MKIEDFIKENKQDFDDKTLPEGHRERFLQTLKTVGFTNSGVSGAYAGRNKVMSLGAIYSSMAAAAVITIAVIIIGINNGRNLTAKLPQTADSQLVEMRTIYDQKVDEAIISLEKVMENVDDSTRIQITEVIHDLVNTGDVFAEIAPLPQDKQIAIVEQIYDNRIKTIERISEKVKR